MFQFFNKSYASITMENNFTHERASHVNVLGCKQNDSKLFDRHINSKVNIRWDQYLIVLQN